MGSNGVPRLLPQHLADLQKSGLSTEQIAACEFRSLTDPSEIAGLLGWHRYTGDLGTFLCIPYPSADGSLNGYCRLKPDRPRVDRKGKRVKYEAPKGSSNHAYFPP